MERDCIREKRGRGKETEAGIDYLAGDKHTRVGGLRGIFRHSNNDNSVMCRKHESITMAQRYLDVFIFFLVL